MKKLVSKGILSMVMLGVMLSVAEAQTVIPVREVSSLQTNCNPAETTNYSWYLKDDGSWTNPYDDFWAKGADALILKNGSYIDIWRNGDVLNKCNKWRRMSNIVKDGDTVVAFENQDDCVFNIPSYVKTSYDSIDAQIHFSIGYRTVWNGGPQTFANNQILFYSKRGVDGYYCYPNGNKVSDANNCVATNVRFDQNENRVHVGECQNYRLFWCGDGLISDASVKYSDNKTYIEECDPNAPEWKNRTDGQRCNTSCKIEYEEPKCSSTYKGTEYKNPSERWLDENTVGLCDKGDVVEFDFTPKTGGPRTYTWSCKNGLKNVSCSAKQQRCGDGEITNGEQCDPADTRSSSVKGWGDGTLYTCNASCEKISVNGPICNSQYDKQTKYQSILSGEWLNSGMKDLCTNGTVRNFQSDKKSPRTFAWDCEVNGVYAQPKCEAKQERCGDGVRSNGEVCDPKDTTREGRGDGCSIACEPTYNKATCGSKYNNTTLHTGSSEQWLTKDTSGLCDNGKVIEFDYTPKMGGPRTYTWKCENGTETSGICTAKQEWCGDGVRNGGEQCDPEDKSEDNWGNDGCDASCNQVNTTSNKCDQEFKYTLRHGEKYTFWDIFKATDADRRLYGQPNVNFLPQKDYNGTDSEPTFRWTNWSSEKKVAKGQEIQVVESTPEYHIKYHPDVRSYDNLYIEYVLSYANRSNAPESRWKSHKECVNYEISRCGDGQIDKPGVGDTWEAEECDPAHPDWKNRIDGKTCDADCKIKDAPQGKLRIEKTLSTAREITNLSDPVKWIIKVTAESGDVKDFVLTDRLPEILNYVSFREISNPSNLRLPNPPELSNNGKLLTWNVEGTLKSGQSLEIELVTRVNKMPTQDEKNWACVEPKGNTDPTNKKCDDDFITGNPGKLIIKKDVEKHEVETVPQDVKWTITVTATGGDVTDFTLSDHLPKILTYKSFSVKKNDSKLTVPSKPDVRTSETTGESDIRWNIKGTLKKGDSLVIELVTTVTEMPTKQELNVACIDKDKAEDEDKNCDDDYIIGNKGALEITKVLSGAHTQVENTGDIVTWKITVKAIGADVTNFTLKDHLPKVLDYSGVNITYNPSHLKMGTHTITKTTTGTTVSWDVKGTLKKDQTFEIELFSVANTMPTQKETNVACVKGENTDPDPKDPDYPDDDCADDFIEPKDGKYAIEKTLIGSKEIVNTGDTVEWKIVVRPVDGNVKDLTITDKMPDVLGYSGYRVVHDGGVKIFEPSTGTNTITWKTEGTLKMGEYIELRVITYAKKMPTKEEKNVACVKGPNPNDPEICDNEELHSPKVWIKKYIVDGEGLTKKKTVKVGETMTYKITFGNSGDASATITSIKDFLPKNVQYVSGSIYLNSNSSPREQFTGGETIDILRGVVSTVTIVDGVHVEKYGGITLKPGDTGYILIEVKVLEKKNEKESTTNFACIYVNDEKKDCDDAVHEITDSELMCKSNIEKNKSNDLCYGSSWTVPVTCESEGGTGDTIAILCDGKEAFTGKNISQLTGSCVFSADGDHTVQCKVNGSTKAASGSNCEGVYNLKHHGCGGGSSPSCSSITTNPATTTSLSKGSNVDVTCKTSNGSAYVLIDCDYKAGKDYSKTGNFMISTGRVTEFTGQCKNYQTASKIQCLVKEYESSSWQSPVTACAKDVTIRPGTSGCFPEGTKVTMADGSQKNIEEVQEGDVVLSYNTATNTNEKNVVKRQIVHTNHEHEMYELTINGEVLKVTDVHPFYVRKSLSSNDYSWIEAQNLKVGNILLMTDGSLVKIEKITHYANLETVYNLEVEGNHNYFVDKGYLVHNKGGKTTDYCDNHPNDPICNFADPECYNINDGNVSVEKLEYLPFYLNVFKNKRSDYKYVVYSGETYPLGKKDNIQKMINTYCNENGLVALNSMQCTYIIKNAEKKVFTDTGPCFDGGSSLKNAPRLIKAWAAWQGLMYNGGEDMQTYKDDGTSYTYAAKVSWTKTSDWDTDDVLGEYQFQITDVEYLQCMDNKRTYGKSGGPVCQNNLMLTSPYTVQKTPAGNLTASTDTLAKFKEVNGNTVFSKYINNIATTVYSKNDNVENAKKNLIDKYKKLAVSVKLQKTSFLSGTDIRKVPGKNIYFVDGDITIKGGKSAISTPFTIVQTNGKTTISGDVLNNMMLLTNGEINFVGSCRENQVVKGILIGNSLSRTVGKNDDLNNGEWCDKGGLHIKGILIGDNFKQLMNNSRSHIESWWMNRNTNNDAKVKIMNGASVLIEYSPSIFTKSTMPPGAEDFTTALSVYKN